MRATLGTAVLLGALALVGCKSKETVKSEPPPPVMETMAPESDPAPAPMVMDMSAPAPAPVAGDALAPTPGKSYVVQKGDTLWSIAKRAYGEPKRWTEIAQANNISSERALKVGQQLNIP